MAHNNTRRRFIIVALLILLFLQACHRAGQFDVPTLPAVQNVGAVASDQAVDRISTPTAKIATSTPLATEIIPAQSVLPRISITAVKGNLFIRRGPDMAFNPIGVLNKNTTAEVVGRDVLSKWVQIILPNSKNTGWVSLQTEYSKIEGDLTLSPEFTPTEWPVPAYIRNCTHHQMYLLPGEITLPSSLETPENEIWLYPGKYTVYDLDVPDYPAVMDVEMREGLSVDIQDNGLGGHRKCP